MIHYLKIMQEIDNFYSKVEARNPDTYKIVRARFYWRAALELFWTYVIIHMIAVFILDTQFNVGGTLGVLIYYVIKYRIVEYRMYIADKKKTRQWV